MPTPRRQQISLADTPYYHCVSRCVRRAFLCGEDDLTGKNFEHRRGWIEDRLLFLASVFSIDVCAYAIMSNHLHVVLHINQSQALNWSMEEVLERWHRIHQGTVFTQQFINGETLPKHAMAFVKASAETYRQRLMDISWFMRELNEPIARMANQEDECTGRFWEGRFKSQALLNESALIACMAYVDLNPLRACLINKEATTPENSDYTSIKKRVIHAKKYQTQPANLLPFLGYEKEETKEQQSISGLPFRLTDYLELVDVTGRVIQEEKRGSIDLTLTPILQRIGLTSSQWLMITTQFEEQFHTAIGSEEDLTKFSANTKRQRRPNLSNCKHLLG
ncbi:transposase [Marinomonas agarivorans]|nr:transposase [Marinomonas agarivorans]